MRILYCAGNRLGSYYQLKRFLTSIGNKYTIKIAAYKKSMGNFDIDYNLDSLLNFTDPDGMISFNGNYSYYKNEIKRYNPDLIISDLEIYTSIIASELKIKLWQFSPINLYYAITNDDKKNIGINKKYSFLIEADHKKVSYINQILNNSNKKFVLSHLCDFAGRPKLIERYEWVRPSFILGENSNSFNNLVAFSSSNKSFINDLKTKSGIIFSPSKLERIDNWEISDIENELVYSNCIENCKSFISDGTAVFLADAFYNRKYCFCAPRYDDMESIIGSYSNEYYGLGKIALPGDSKEIKISINDNVKFISEHLEQL